MKALRETEGLSGFENDVDKKRPPRYPEGLPTTKANAYRVIVSVAVRVVPRPVAVMVAVWLHRFLKRNKPPRRPEGLPTTNANA